MVGQRSAALAMTSSSYYGGCYDASRAAALSGVPKSTVYDWARKGVVVPSVSPEQEKLWSYADLMALRIVSWLRRRKGGDEGAIPPSPMPRVRAALDALATEGIALWVDGEPSALVVEESGKVLIRRDGELHDPVTGATSFPDPLSTFGLTAPFVLDGHRGPDLIRPRQHLRILPGKVAGEPHIEGTRITTAAIAGLLHDGYPAAAVADMYGLAPFAVEEARDLEQQLGLLPSAA